MLLTLPNFVTAIGYRAQEMALASYATVELVYYMNLATHDIRGRHDWSELESTADLSFVKSSTLPYATVTKTTGFWAPIYLNNAADDYKFWWAEPGVIRSLDTDDRYTYPDVEHAIGVDHGGTNFILYHDTTETLTLKYYSKYLVKTVTTGVAKETWAANGTDADTFLLENDDMLLTRTLMYLAQKEPKTLDQYSALKGEFEQYLADEKKLHPSQRMPKLEEIQFIG